MSEFKKPTRVEVDINQALKDLLGRYLIKDLYDNEAICPVCGGIGIIVEENRYGLAEDSEITSGILPCKHMSIRPCPNCYNGVVRICPDCGKQILREFTKCSCEAEQQRQAEHWLNTYLGKLHHAIYHSPSALGTKFQYVYYEEYNYNEGYFDDWNSFFDYWHNNHTDSDDKPEFVWGTTEIPMTLNANDIIDRACEDLYEGAECDISSDARKEMQDYFDKWLNEHKILSYACDERHAIRIPWEDDQND